MRDFRVLIKGAGEMASGIAHRLYSANIRQIVMTDIAEPLCVRRAVSFCEAIFTGTFTVEGVAAEAIRHGGPFDEAWKRGRIAVIVDPAWTIVDLMKPDVVVDSIMAKKPTRTRSDEASLVIGVGPGFEAPRDVHAVIESNRGHDLGRVIYEGHAEPFTGIPGLTAGYRKERVLRAPHAGRVGHVKHLGDEVAEGEVVLQVGETPVIAAISGILRGLIREIDVGENEKVGDIEPRGKTVNLQTISDKARAIGGGVLEAVMHRFNT